MWSNDTANCVHLAYLILNQVSLMFIADTFRVHMVQRIWTCLVTKKVFGLDIWNKAIEFKDRCPKHVYGLHNILYYTASKLDKLYCNSTINV